MRTTLILLMLAAGAALAQSQTGHSVWKWVDADGIVHYSDRPVPGAERVDLKVQTYTSPKVQPPPTAAPAAPAAGGQSTADEPYRNLEIWKPVNDQAIVNTAGQVEVRLRLEPGLKAGHAIWLYLDGKRVDGLAEDASDFELSGVARGTHTLQAAVADGGKMVTLSDKVIFHVVQASTAQPPVGPALRPPPKPTPRPSGGPR